MTASLYKSQAVELSASDSSLVISGAPGFDSAPELCSAGIEWLQGTSAPAVSFDATQVQVANSGVLCVLIEWLRAARSRQLKVSAITLPPRLMELVRISDLTPVLNPGVDRASR